ncbi:MAG: hypothetical protein QOG04_183 [Actinomycetota bacterium]|jgi:hypothetical protein|nr:hypothetical protein [Actinomycetota bacterium]
MEEAQRDEVRRAAAHLSSGVWGGILSGFVIGGIGGRLAMFVLRLTSDPSIRGLDTDDGFKIGSLTGSTLFLVGITMAAGMLGGLVYLLVRGWLPQQHRALYMASFFGLFGGATIVKPDGIDFTRVEPHVLSICFFILLPALYGAAVSIVTERFLDREEGRQSTSLVFAFLPLLGIGLVGPGALVILALGFGGWMLNRSYPLAALWNSPWVTRLGRTGLAVLTALAVVTLIEDITEIL